MTYKYLNIRNGLQLVIGPDGATFPLAPGNQDYELYQQWLSEGNVTEPADPIIPSPEWKEFLKSLRETSVFTILRSQARVNVEANALATELRTELGEAALGISTEGNIQPLLNELSVGLTTSQKQEISNLITIHHIPLTIDVGIGTT